MRQSKPTDEALHEGDELLRSPFGASSRGIVAIGVEGEIIASNRAYNAMLGYEDGELIGVSVLDLVPEEDREPLKLKLQALASGHSVPRFCQYRHVTRGGQVIDSEVAWDSQHGSRGEVVGHVCIVTDVSERKRLEEKRRRLEDQILHAQKIEGLGVLAGGIAHEFSNLLTTIQGNAELAMQHLSPRSTGRKRIEGIIGASKRAADLARQMLAYSGRGQLVPETLDLSRLVEGMVQTLQASVGDRAALSFRLADGLPAIEADATQVRQVITNLVTNAFEAMDDHNGAISVTTGTMAVDRQYFAETCLDDNLPEGPYVTLEVTDTGCGMDAETRTKLFDPFFTTKFTGRGLGMAAALGIVRGHKGAISIHSKMGAGTTVRVLLPTAAYQPEAVPDPTTGSIRDSEGNQDREN